MSVPTAVKWEPILASTEALADRARSLSIVRTLGDAVIPSSPTGRYWALAWLINMVVIAVMVRTASLLWIFIVLSFVCCTGIAAAFVCLALIRRRPQSPSPDF